MTRSCALVLAGALAIAGSGLAADPADAGTAAQGAVPAGPGTPVRRGAPAAVVMPAGSSSITGVAWNADSTPIPLARLRLRNVVTGTVQTVTIANELGQFEFRSVETGSYAVELVNEDGKVLTVGQTFSVGPGETVATFVRLGAKDPWFNGFFGNAAAAVSAAAAAAGITAIAPEQVPCASPPCGTDGSR